MPAIVSATVQTNHRVTTKPPLRHNHAVNFDAELILVLLWINTEEFTGQTPGADRSQRSRGQMQSSSLRHLTPFHCLNWKQGSVCWVSVWADLQPQAGRWTDRLCGHVVACCHVAVSGEVSTNVLNQLCPKQLRCRLKSYVELHFERGILYRRMNQLAMFAFCTMGCWPHSIPWSGNRGHVSGLGIRWPLTSSSQITRWPPEDILCGHVLYSFHFFGLVRGSHHKCYESITNVCSVLLYNYDITDIFTESSDPMSLPNVETGLTLLA